MCFLQKHLWCLFSHLIVYCLRRGAPHTWSTPNKFGFIVWMKWTCTTLSTVGCAIFHRWRATQHRWRGFVRLMAWESGPQSRWLRQTLRKGLLWLVDFKGFKNSLSKSFNPQLARNLAVFNLYHFQLFVPFGTCVLICESRKPTKTKSQQQETRRKTTTHTHNTKNGLKHNTKTQVGNKSRVQSSCFTFLEHIGRVKSMQINPEKFNDLPEHQTMAHLQTFGLLALTISDAWSQGFCRFLRCLQLTWSLYNWMWPTTRKPQSRKTLSYRPKIAFWSQIPCRTEIGWNEKQHQNSRANTELMDAKQWAKASTCCNRTNEATYDMHIWYIT